MKVNNWTIKDQLEKTSSPCVLCGSDSIGAVSLCRACQQDLSTGYPACQHCALPLSGELPALICGQCQNQAPYYRQAYSYALYAPPLDRMIQHLKFHQKLYFARLLGNLMARDIVARQLEIPEVLIPVPLHTQRLRERGYNQALELARPIAKTLGVALDIHSCRRNKLTSEQSGLAAKQRKLNVKDAFTVTGNVRGRHVAIVDDVMTTGSTVNEFTKQLLSAGATTVDVWVCARAEAQHSS